MSGGGSGSRNTNTQVQQIPAFEQEASQNNQALAQSIGAQPFPTYQGDLIQSMTPLQSSGQDMAVQAASAYSPYLQGANVTANGALDPSNVNAATSAAAGSAGQAQSLTNPNAISSYMNPYIQQALAPQIQDLQLQLGQEQQGINTNATQANAFGDARQGAAQALQNLYGNQAMNQLVSTGYNNAYTQAQSALGQAENTNLGAAGIYNTAGQIQGAEQQTQLTGANDIANLGSLAQSEGLTGANAI